MTWYVGSDSQWADDMRAFSAFFREKCQNWDKHWWKPSIYEDQPYPEQENDVGQIFASLERFADVHRVLAGIEGQMICLEAAKKCLDGDALDATFRDIEKELDQWEGDTAEAFSTYLRGTPEDDKEKNRRGTPKQNPGVELALANCQDRITACWYAFEAYRKVIQGFRDDVHTLVGKAKEAIEKAETIDEKIELMVLSAVYAVGAAALTAGGSLLMATVAVGNALQAGIAAAGSYTINGNTVFEIMFSMQEGLNRLLLETESQLAQVSNAFETAADYMVGGHLEDVRPARPSVVSDDKFNPDEFSPGNVPDDVSDDVSTDDLVKEPGEETENVPGNPGELERGEREDDGASDDHRV